MKPQLLSTRGIEGQSVPLKTAILKSQPEDKGLYTFSEFPQIDPAELQKLQGLPYPELSKAILSKFDFGIPEKELHQIIDSSYGDQWDTEEITPVTKLDNNEYLLELYHGPTQAFKDVALQFLPRVLSSYRQPDETLRALGASSGDTISAAHFGVGDVEGLQSCFLLPKSGPSKIQRLQATAHGFRNAITILIEGSFDDGQKVIKEILTNPKHAEMKRDNNFTSFNSINIARIMAQIVYYFHAYLDLVKKEAIQNGDPINFSTPSGNFGDALAGIYAQKMGLPINKINVATNANDVLHKFLQTGRYTPGSELIQTLAPSQDITVASNFERMVFEVVRDPQRVAGLMNDLNAKGYFEVTDQELGKFRKSLESSSTDDDEIADTIRDTYQGTKKVIDPHTATGVHGGISVFGKNPKIPTVYLATAEHIKFNQPAGVPKDEKRYNAVVGPLERNPEDYLVSLADEKSIVNAVKEAVNRVNERISN
jgi:threonine synthase